MSKQLSETIMPTEADVRWAKKHGWTWDGERFAPTPVLTVIVNPLARDRPGWTPWHAAIGALQMEAPFGSVRAALRVAQSIRLGRQLADNEMNCSED